MTPEKPRSRAAMLREIEAVIAENARLLGEEPELAVRFTPKRGWPGWVRIYQVLPDGRLSRKDYREYLGLAGGLEAARIANERAKRVHALIEAGVPKADAIRESATR